MIFGAVQFWTGVVMIEDIFDSKQFEWQSDQENVVRRIAALNDIESALNVNPQRVYNFPKERPSIFPDIADWAVTFPSHWMPIDVDSIENDMLIHVAFGTRT